MAQATAIRELGADALAGAVGVAARGMRDNPLNVAAFGNDGGARLERLRRMFTIAMPATLRKGVMLGAFDGETLVGVAAMVPPGRCRPTAAETVAMLPRMILALGFGGAARLGRWFGEWGRRDLREPHWHLGPVAVDPGSQRRGVGRALLVECCARIDRAGDPGFLETDKPQNVEFYKRFGFETVGEAPVLGTPNWFMRRPRA
jgi:ribosomal protein S18 acetylase RimI-like enzyme